MLSNTIMSVAAIFGALAVIGGGIISIYKIARRLDDAVGTDEEGRTIAERLNKVEYQLWENGGSSLADRVNRIERSSEHTATEVSLIKDILLNMIAPVQEKPVRKTRRAGGASPAFGLSTFNTEDK
jgi:hypothetical protein